MRVLVCGGRDYNDREHLFAELDRFADYNPVTYVIHGGARGADQLAGEWARERGIQEVICPANWDFFQKAAGPKRNLKMLGLGIDTVIAFPGGNGTQHMIESSLKREVPVVSA